jgi:hypothetical protein
LDKKTYIQLLMCRDIIKRPGGLPPGRYLAIGHRMLYYIPAPDILPLFSRHESKVDNIIILKTLSTPTSLAKQE